MPIRMLFTWLGLLAAINQSLRADEPPLTGRLLSAAGKPIVGALVLVCDQKTGLPVDPKTFRPFQNWEELASTTTNERGEFSIPSPKPGMYRLIAQSWEEPKKVVEKPLETNGATVNLHGIADQVEVPAKSDKELVIRPIGNSSLTINTDPLSGNNETLLVISRGALAADPVLGFAAWSGEFMPQMLAWNRMPLGTTTIHGLPEGEVHMATFSIDNNPGSGGETVALERGGRDVVSVKVFASWSDGHKQPPTVLEPLVKKVQSLKNGDAFPLILEQVPELQEASCAEKGPISVMVMMSQLLDRQIELPSGEKVPLKDLAAANAYAYLLRAEQARLKRLQ